MMNNDINAIVKWAEQNGYTTKTTQDGYTQFFDPDGNYIAHYPNTPGNSYRRMLDLKVALKKSGLQIPPPSKKEQRAQRTKRKG